ncbi:MAG: hypothetical protein DDT22_01036 [candidate division WS2 bacterium]|nr:hypothetical protein [Candidatus Lithacetigena glycinireducens]
MRKNSIRPDSQEQAGEEEKMFDLTRQVFKVMGLYETGSRFQPERPAIDNSLLRGSEETEQGDTIGEIEEGEE